jgi:hypothetical protein
VRITEGATDVALTVQSVARGAALHLIRYDHDTEHDAVAPLERLGMEVRLPFEVASAEVVAPGGGCSIELVPGSGDAAGVQLRDVPLYAIVVLSP